MANDWLEDYLKYTAPQESPEIFHFWSGVAVIAGVLNKRVFLPRIAANGVLYYTNFPGQLSPILIAGSGKAKKSTAINIAKGFMKTSGVKLFERENHPRAIARQTLNPETTSHLNGNRIRTVRISRQTILQRRID